MGLHRNAASFSEHWRAVHLRRKKFLRGDVSGRWERASMVLERGFVRRRTRRRDQGSGMTFCGSGLRSFLAVRSGCVDVVTRGEDRAVGLGQDWSTSSDCGVDVPFLHGSSSFNSPRLVRCDLNWRAAERMDCLSTLLVRCEKKLPRNFPRSPDAKTRYENGALSPLHPLLSSSFTSSLSAH